MQGNILLLLSIMKKQHFYFTKIVIAGGAIKSLSAIGSIAYLEEVHLVQTLKHFVGTSAGSIICLFMVLGYSAQEIVKFFNENIVKDEIANVNIEDFFGIVDNYGLNLGRNLEVFLSNIIYEKMKVKDVSFLDIAKHTGKDFVVCVANLSKEKEEFWSVDTVPNMSVIKAIRTSCSLPILFTPIKHNGDLYLDGGLYNNFPIDYFTKSVSNIKDIIGINIVSTSKETINTFVDYITKIFQTVTNRLTKEYTNELNDNILTLQFEDEGWISFKGMRIDISKETLEKYILTGYQKMKELIKEYEKLYEEKIQYEPIE
jgi:predicted acylesterase/phospholipase RssA